MGIVKERHTYVTDKEGHTITTDTREYGGSVSIRESIKLGVIAMPKLKESRLKLFSEEEIKEMGYESEENLKRDSRSRRQQGPSGYSPRPAAKDFAGDHINIAMEEPGDDMGKLKAFALCEARRRFHEVDIPET